MTLHLEIPESIVHAMRLPMDEQPKQLLVELAVSLYARGVLSFGKARELAGMNMIEFGLLLGQRSIPRHYSDEDLQDDLKYARGE